MSIFYIISIMIVTGIIGGLVYFFSDANTNPKPTANNGTPPVEHSDAGVVPNSKNRPWAVCILLGFAATLTVPFFLKLADSKLLEDIHIKPTANSTTKRYQSFTIYNTTDSSKHTIKSDTVPDKKITTAGTKAAASDNSGDEDSSAKNYLLWAAYCLLAAAAGIRFIDFLINKLISEKQIENIKKENQEVKTENNVLTEKVAVQDKNNMKRMAAINLNEAHEFSKEITPDPDQIKGMSADPGKKELLNISRFTPSSLPPITNPDDPQKGRFGGKASRNGRTLSVTYGSYPAPFFLNLTFTIKADADAPLLNGDIFLFLHDTFPKSLVKLTANNSKEISYSIPAYGAFTIGAALDNGDTLLELDLAEVKTLPDDFRER